MAGGGFALIVLVAAGLWLAETPERVRKPLPEMVLTQPHSVVLPSALAPVAEKTKPFKLVYRNSVIPGGVHSPAELAAALQSDPVVAAHYKNFDVAAARLVQVEKSRLVHVSYRIGDNIYWTKKKVRLAAGEYLLSDGKHLVRTRCGNRIADEPEGPVLDYEPAPEMLESVFVSTEDLIDQTVNMAAANGSFVPTTATAATTATNAQPIDTRLASSMAPVASIAFPNLWDLRSPAQSTQALKNDPVSFAPALIERFEPNVVDTVSGGTPPANPVPEVVKPAMPDSATPKPPVTPDSTPKPPATPDSTPKPPATPDSTTPQAPATPDPKPPHTLPESSAPVTPTPTPDSQPAASTPPAPTPVPEPGSAALIALALIALTLVRRLAGRKRRSR